MAVKFYVNSVDIETLGCVESWDGILAEGPIRGDVIEQDWVDGAIWQQGKVKTYSFEVPLTFHTNVVNPLLADAILALDTIKTWRGPLLNFERRVPNNPADVTSYRRQTSQGVLVSDLAPRVQAGRFVSVTLVFQNTKAVWTTV